MDDGYWVVLRQGFGSVHDSHSHASLSVRARQAY